MRCVKEWRAVSQASLRRRSPEKARTAPRRRPGRRRVVLKAGKKRQVSRYSSSERVMART